MLASPLDPLPDLRKDFRPWSIFMRLWSAACHGRPLLLRKAELVTKIRQREQRTKNKAESQWQRQCGETQRPSWSQRPCRRAQSRHCLCDQLDLRAAPEFWQRQGPRTGPRCKNRFCGFWVPNVLVFMLNRKSYSLGHPEAPRGDFDQISGTVVRLLARLQGAHLEVLRVGVPRFLFGGDDHMGPESVRGVPTRRDARQKNLLHLRQWQNRLGFLRGWQTLRWRCELQQGSQEGLAARGRKEGPRAEREWGSQEGPSWAFPSWAFLSS